jgi:hypothetical protein
MNWLDDVLAQAQSAKNNAGENREIRTLADSVQRLSNALRFASEKLSGIGEPVCEMHHVQCPKCEARRAADKLKEF